MLKRSGLAGFNESVGSTMKTVGVLGGLGPQATMDFEARIHAVSRGLIPPVRSGGYPPMVVYYYRHSPYKLTPDLIPVMPLHPHPRLLDAAKKLGQWADFLVITANAPHLFREEIEQAFGGPVLSMIDVTMDEVQRRGLKTVGVLGLNKPRVYLRPLAQRSLTSVILSDQLSARLNEAIFSFMEGREASESQLIAREAVEFLRAQGAEGIILGCTEIPLLLREDSDVADLINPTQLLAEATVRYAIA